MGPDELLTGKKDQVFRGKCSAMPDAPDCIVKQFAPQPSYVQKSLESCGIRKRRKDNRGGGSIVTTR